MKTTTISTFLLLFVSSMFVSCEQDYITDGSTSGFNIHVVSGKLNGTSFTNSSDLTKVATYTEIDNMKKYFFQANSTKVNVSISIGNFEDKQMNQTNNVVIYDKILKTTYRSVGGAGTWNVTDLKDLGAADGNFHNVKATYTFEGKFKVSDSLGNVIDEGASLKGKIKF